MVWLLLHAAGLPYGVSIALGILATGLVGALIYRFIIIEYGVWRFPR